MRARDGREDRRKRRYLTEKYLMEEEITDDELMAALRAATIAGKVHPVLCGSALKNKGVQLCWTSVVELLPSPLDVPPVTGITSRRPTRNSSRAIGRRADWRRWSSRS